MTLAEMKQRKRELGLTNQMISEQSGIPFGTVQKIFSGGTKAPRYDTILALEKVLAPEPRTDHAVDSDNDRERFTYKASKSSVSGVRESKGEYKVKYIADHGDESSAFTKRADAGYDKAVSHIIEKEKKAGEYTTDDYYALPDNYRAELIDGVLYGKVPPLGWHQAFTGMIYARLLSVFMHTKQKYVPFVSPVRVQLEEDEKTMMEPDIVVLSDLSKFSKGRILGAPDLVIEILSKPTRKRDIGLKLYKYMEAGVREYWIVDHIARKVYQYDFEHDAAINIYDFENEVPVLISAEACSVDMAEIERFYRDAGLGPDA